MKLKTLIRQASLYIYNIATAILFSVPYKIYAENIFNQPEVKTSPGSSGNSSGLKIPDYTDPIQIPLNQTTFIAPSDGYIYVRSYWDSQPAAIQVNGNYIDFSRVGNMGYGSELTNATGFVKKGSVCTIIGNQQKTFYPIK